MILNHYEHTQIKNSKLPVLWQSQEALDDLSDFLQQNWEQRTVFYEDGEISSKQQFLSFVGKQGMKAKNYIGTIVFNGEQLNIYPKVFRTEADDHDTEDLTQKHLMNNLVRWLEYCNKMTYPFINISSELDDSEDLKELFITLYIGYVRSSLDRGLYFQYVDETDNCSSIKGKFDLRDYITNKIPNVQANKFKCTYSNFEFDNKVNRIIKCVCKQLFNTTSKKNQKVLRSILTKLDEVSTVAYIPNECDNIRLSKMHSHYRIILSMSKMFLLNKMSNYSMDSHESFCFLFPTELLFEGFVSGFMQEVIQSYHGKVRLQQSSMNLIEDIVYDGRSLGAAFTMRHDILVELNDKVFILDAKYKQVSRFEGNNEQVKKVVSTEPKQTDIYQVCEYARKRDIKDVYLLYPMYRYEDRELTFPRGINKSPKGDINVHFIRVPFVFEDDAEKIKAQLTGVIKQVLSIQE